MGFQRSVRGRVGRKRLEAKPAIYSRSVVLMVVFPYAEECWFCFYCFVLFFFSFFLFFCSLQKDCSGLGSNCPAPEHFQGALMAQTMCLISCLMTIALKFLLPFELSAVCLESEEVTESFALVHSMYGSLH